MPESPNFTYSYIFNKLAFLVVKELMGYASKTLEDSAKTLKSKSEAIAAVSREGHFAPFRESSRPPVHTLEDYLSYARADLHSLRKEVDELCQHGDQHEGQASSKQTIDQLTVQLRTLSQQAESAERLRKVIQQQETVYIAVTPIKTKDYEGVRVILPIDASLPIPPHTLIDFIYAYFNIKIWHDFQIEAFGQPSVEYTRQSNVRVCDNGVYHAIDICFGLKQSKLAEFLGHLGEFLLKAATSEQSNTEKQGNAELSELIDSNIQIKPFFLPPGIKEFIESYYKEIKPEIDMLTSPFMNFLETSIFHGKPQPLKEPQEAVMSRVFESLEPYRQKLDEIIEMHKLPVRERVYSDLLHSPMPPQIAESGGIYPEEGPPKYIDREQAKKVLHLPEKIFKAMIDAGAIKVDPKDPSKIDTKSLLESPRKVVWGGKYFRGAYPVEVMTSGAFARENNLDIEKFTELCRRGDIPLRAKTSPPTLYIIDLSNTSRIIEIYHRLN